MKRHITLGLTVVGILSLGAVQAQEVQQLPQDSTATQNEISTETRMKSYTIVKNDSTYENAVRITTTQKEAIAFKENSDLSDPNLERIMNQKMIEKVVEIDNDKDPEFDERIRFGYRADAPTDFVLVSNDDEILVAVDEGDDLKLIKDESFSKKDVQNQSNTYVYTDNDGEDVAFFIKSFEDMEKPENKSLTGLNK